MPRRIDRQLTEVLVEWDNYCQALGRRFAEGVYGPDDLTAEAQVVLWELLLEVEDPASDDFRKQAKTRIPRRLTDLVRSERAGKRDCKAAVALTEIVNTDVLGSGSSFAQESVELEEGLARLDAMLDNDEQELLHLIVNGSKKLQRILRSYQRRPRSHWSGGAGRRALAQTLKWSEKKTRRVIEAVQYKATIAFVA